MCAMFNPCRHVHAEPAQYEGENLVGRLRDCRVVIAVNTIPGTMP